MEIIQHRTRPIFGLQFHPEQFEKSQDGEAILMNIFAAIT